MMMNFLKSNVLNIRILMAGFFILALAAISSAQVVTSIPRAATIDDSILVIFDAKEGDGGLAGFTGDVYVHTGVITDQSTGPGDWKHVIGNWGENNIQPQLTSLGDDRWQLTVGDIRSFYGVPENENVRQLAFVFRSADSQITGRDVGGADIFLDILESTGAGRVVTTTPEVPSTRDSVLVFFHATEGDGGLAGFTGDVYVHTGLITDQSNNPSDWKHVIGDWGDNLVQPQLTNVGPDLWQLTIGDIRTFYGVASNERVLALAMVFRSADSNLTGRDVGGADIFADVLDPTPTVTLISPRISQTLGDPLREPAFVARDDTLRFVATSTALGAEFLSLTLLLDETPVAQVTADTLRYDFIAAQSNAGMHNFLLLAERATGETDTTGIAVMVNPEVSEAARPAGIVDGVNLVDNSTVTVSIFAPRKEFAYVIGDFNDWTIDPAYFMNRETIREDSVHYWLNLTELDPDASYGFQYFIDGELRVADPYTRLVLQAFDDQFIPASVFPDLKLYPDGKTTDNVSVFRISEEAFDWQVAEFQKPEKSDLVIYELLVRDFIAAHDYSTMVDTLDYLDRLGVTAIELMPVTEFEGNSSWGYNPASYFAPDKYYGPADDLKRFIDECHKRGIAVILDMVLNHSFGQHPLVRLYSSGNFGPPTDDNPWYNRTARHPFNVGFDFNHESSVTKAFVDRVNAYWLTEFKVDGFRFDLSKGFTQKFSNNDGQFRLFDQSRVDILKRMADRIWEVDSTAYVILEHFAENREEIELTDYGMMVWGNMNIAYSQSAMGWLSDPQQRSDLAGGYYKNRGFSKPHLITYMESHDEPWLTYKNLRFGRQSSNGSYNVKELTTALERIKLVATFFLTIPGPKMMWQFGELGYDQELPEIGRTDPKPILWNYFENEERRSLYKFMSALLKLRKEVEAFRSPVSNVQMRVGQSQFDRRIQISHPSTNVTIIGNFDVFERDVNPAFIHSGTWYDYFFRDSVNVVNSNEPMRLKPGEFHLFTDRNVGFPEEILVTSVVSSGRLLPEEFNLLQNYPNPFNPETTIRFELAKGSDVKIEIYNMLGQKVKTLVNRKEVAGSYSVTWDGKSALGNDVGSGVYVARMVAGDFNRSIKLLKLK